MADIWSMKINIKFGLEIELLATEAQAELGVVPKEAAVTTVKMQR